MSWKAATKDEVIAAMAQHRVGLDPAYMGQFDRYLIDPVPSLIRRFGGDECAYIVARSATHVVIYDDIEGDFGTAREVDGRIVDEAYFGDLALALRELRHLESLDDRR